MSEKKLSALLQNLEIVQRRGPDDLTVSRLVYDSREVGPGAAFFALPGLHVDGHSFVPQVIAAGCRVIFHSADLPEYQPGVAYVQVRDTRFTMSPAADAFFDHPSRELTVIGVTGTDGKSSTVSFLHQLLEASGHPAGFFSTVQWKTGSQIQANSFRQSTPEAPQIHGILREMKTNGLQYAVVESTSHGLSPRTNRLGNVTYTAAVFTNVTLEHLEFHGTVEQYRQDKARLFAALDRGPANAFGVVNRDDPHADLFISATKRPVLTYSRRDPQADLYVSRLEETDGRLHFSLRHAGQEAAGTLNIPGSFNIENLMAALLTIGRLLGQSPLDLVPLASQIVAVKGRMCAVRQGQPFEVLIDYAHTPGAYEKILPAVKAGVKGRLIAVFGSAGERDREKRPLQGALADKWADVIVLTEEDPRLEGNQPILDDIQAGIKNKTLGQDLFRVTPRTAALEWAFDLARPGDTVLLLGKGHEQSIIYAHGSEKYDEEAVAKALLIKAGYQP